MDVDTTGHRLGLLVLDMQWVFLSPDGPFGNTVAGPVVDGVNAAAALCRDRDVPVLFSRYVLRDDLRDAGLLGGLPFVPMMRRSAPESRLDERLVVTDGDVVLEHHRPSAFHDADLDAVLRGLGVTALVLAGVSVNNAVSATARDAFARDVPVIVPREAVGAAPGEADVDVYFAVLDTWTARVVPLAGLGELLPARPPA